MTITIGFWIVPALITLVGVIHSLNRPRSDYGLDIVPLAYLFANIVAWAMYFLSFLFGGAS